VPGITCRLSHTSCPEEAELPGTERPEIKRYDDKTSEPLESTKKCSLQIKGNVLGESALGEILNSKSVPEQGADSETKLSNLKSCGKNSEKGTSSNALDQGWFSTTASLFIGNFSWIIRTLLAVLCAIFYVFSNLYAELEYSSVLLTISVDLGYFVVIIVQSRFITNNTMSEPTTGSQAWLNLIRLTASSYVPSQLSFVLGCLLLFLYLALQIFRDIFIMLFVIVMFNSALLYFY